LSIIVCGFFLFFFPFDIYLYARIKCSQPSQENRLPATPFQIHQPIELPQQAFDETITHKYGRVWNWTPEEWQAARQKHYLEGMKLLEIINHPPAGEKRRRSEYV
jgi:hypothetical protein